jgi:hypothetical protein
MAGIVQLLVAGFTIVNTPEQQRWCDEKARPQVKMLHVVHWGAVALGNVWPEALGLFTDGCIMTVADAQV